MGGNRGAQVVDCLLTCACCICCICCMHVQTACSVLYFTVFTSWQLSIVIRQSIQHIKICSDTRKIVVGSMTEQGIFNEHCTPFGIFGWCKDATCATRSTLHQLVAMKVPCRGVFGLSVSSALNVAPPFGFASEVAFILPLNGRCLGIMLAAPMTPYAA